MAGALVQHQRGHEGVENISPEELSLLDHLHGICASKAFESSVTLKNLLIYLFNNRNKKISEYQVAVEALYRNTDFDSQIDASVRVQVSRLRRRLRDYYQAEGRSTAVRFYVPLGTHELVAEHVAESAALTEYPYHPPVLEERRQVPAKQVGRRWGTSSTLTIALLCSVVLLAMLSGWLYWQLRSQARAAVPAASAQMLPLWREFDMNGKPARIVVPNPTFFTWSTANDLHLMVRDTFVNDYADLDKSNALANLKKQLGTPQLSEYYTVSSDVIASLKLTQYMESKGVNINTTISSNTSAEQFEGENVILLGTPGTLTPYKNQLDRLYFKFDPQARLLINPQPLATEKHEYPMIAESPSRAIYPGLVAFLPGISKDSRLLVMAGSETDALVSYLTSSSGSEALEAARKSSGGSPFFEAVIMSEVDGNTVLHNHLVAFRTFVPNNAQN